MSVEVGMIVEGKVTGITKFGAFVALSDGKSGLVHISEIANSFVSDVSAFVQMGQSVKVRVLSITDEGKINLSIKRAVEESAAPERAKPIQTGGPRRPVAHVFADEQKQQRQEVAAGPGSDPVFEERLKKFMQESDSRMADRRPYFEHKSRNRRR